MHALFYSNISEFSGNLEGMLDEGTYKKTMQNMHNIVWKAQFYTTLFRSDYTFSMIILIMMFWSNKNKLLPKTTTFGSKPKKTYGEGQYY